MQAFLLDIRGVYGFLTAHNKMHVQNYKIPLSMSLHHHHHHFYLYTHMIYWICYRIFNVKTDCFYLLLFMFSFLAWVWRRCWWCWWYPVCQCHLLCVYAYSIILLFLLFVFIFTRIIFDIINFYELHFCFDTEVCIIICGRLLFGFVFIFIFYVFIAFYDFSSHHFSIEIFSVFYDKTNEKLKFRIQ